MGRPNAKDRKDDARPSHCLCEIRPLSQGLFSVSLRDAKRGGKQRKQSARSNFRGKGGTQKLEIVLAQEARAAPGSFREDFLTSARRCRGSRVSSNRVKPDEPGTSVAINRRSRKPENRGVVRCALACMAIMPNPPTPSGKDISPQRIPSARRLACRHSRAEGVWAEGERRTPGGAA